METYERCKTCKRYIVITDDCFINSFHTPLIDDSEECKFYERNENIAQNKTKEFHKEKEKSQAELLAEAMRQRTMDVVNGYIGHADMVNHPSHYADSCSMECIESMEIAFGVEYTAVYCLINAYKYLWRRKAKNCSQDVKKALWYLNRYTSYVDNLGYVLSYEKIKQLDDKSRFMFKLAYKALEEYGDKEYEKNK